MDKTLFAPDRRGKVSILTLSLLAAVFLALSCPACSKEPATIPITLEFGEDVTEAEREAAERFLVAATNSDGLTTLFPGECFPVVNDKSCFVNEKCGLSLETSDAIAVPLLFEEYREGSRVTIIVCAVDGSNAVVAGGTGEVFNKGGEEVRKVKLEKDTTCVDQRQDGFLSPCPTPTP